MNITFFKSKAMKPIPTLLLLPFLLMFFSCSDSKRYDTITGDWTCVSWTSPVQSGNQCDDNVFFTFHRDKTYHSNIGGERDTGTYWIDQRFIAFDPNDKLKIKVEVINLTSDTLSFHMNNAGIQEKMVLTRAREENLND